MIITNIKSRLLIIINNITKLHFDFINSIRSIRQIAKNIFKSLFFMNFDL
jgi:hypothetical protein